MICWIVLMSFICGVFVVREASSFHQAKTNDNITIKWDIKIKTDMSHFILVCLLEVKGIKTVVFCVKNGVEVPESQDERFAGRVQFDKDVLREGRIRLHVSRLRTDDSGNYWCDLSTIHGKTRTNDTFVLNVTASNSKLTTNKGSKHPSEGPTLGQLMYYDWTRVFFSFCFFIVLLVVFAATKSSRARFCQQKDPDLLQAWCCL